MAPRNIVQTATPVFDVLWPGMTECGVRALCTILAAGRKRMQIATDAAASWATARPEVTKDFQHDADVHSKFWAKGYDLLAALPEKPKRNPEQARACETILNTGRTTREDFMLRHAEPVYAALTGKLTQFVRAEP
ncbi:MAG TPA: hypothetical protein VM146_12070, partial [Steroidobacteraceae bacterium]|nr:hypothetical protein [Steroidobacteraceae bacterium]